MMHLISDIPDPAAYGAKVLTSRADVNAKRPYEVSASRRKTEEGEWLAHSKHNIKNVIERPEYGPPFELRAALEMLEYSTFSKVQTYHSQPPNSRNSHSGRRLLCSSLA
jgi:hypothetical protein